ncbi:hypothetical protein EI693_14755 [Pseudomonas oryziphila]|uniref:Uncharacterized protein n=1 Tax=Pseudomonas oryziphila TaxID=2894079 RepID=A0ABM7CS55_9PSED|nr:hypothetical protein EI693_14755 [Pseudomonas oryziphila]
MAGAVERLYSKSDNWRYPDADCRSGLVSRKGREAAPGPMIAGAATQPFRGTRPLLQGIAQALVNRDSPAPPCPASATTPPRPTASRPDRPTAPPATAARGH